LKLFIFEPTGSLLVLTHLCIQTMGLLPYKFMQKRLHRVLKVIETDNPNSLKKIEVPIPSFFYLTVIHTNKPT